MVDTPKYTYTYRKDHHLVSLMRKIKLKEVKLGMETTETKMYKVKKIPMFLAF